MMLSVAFRLKVGDDPMFVGAVEGLDVTVQMDNRQVWAGLYNVEVTAASNDTPASTNMVCDSSCVYGLQIFMYI